MVPLDECTSHYPILHDSCRDKNSPEINTYNDADEIDISTRESQMATTGQCPICWIHDSIALGKRKVSRGRTVIGWTMKGGDQQRERKAVLVATFGRGIAGLFESQFALPRSWRWGTECTEFRSMPRPGGRLTTVGLAAPKNTLFYCCQFPQHWYQGTCRQSEWTPLTSMSSILKRSDGGHVATMKTWEF